MASSSSSSSSSAKAERVADMMLELEAAVGRLPAVDNSRPIMTYFNGAANLRRQALAYESQGEVEQAYIFTKRFAKMFLEVISAHNAIGRKEIQPEKTAVTRQVNAAITQLKTIKAQVLDMYMTEVEASGGASDAAGGAAGDTSESDAAGAEAARAAAAAEEAAIAAAKLATAPGRPTGAGAAVYSAAVAATPTLSSATSSTASSSVPAPVYVGSAVPVHSHAHSHTHGSHSHSHSHAPAPTASSATSSSSSSSSGGGAASWSNLRLPTPTASSASVAAPRGAAGRASSSATPIGRGGGPAATSSSSARSVPPYATHATSPAPPRVPTGVGRGSSLPVAYATPVSWPGGPEAKTGVPAPSGPGFAPATARGYAPPPPAARGPAAGPPPAAVPPRGAPSSSARAAIRSRLQVGRLRPLCLPHSLITEFLKMAWSNTSRDIETCGILTGQLREGKLVVTTVIVPKQHATSNTCVTASEEELFALQDKYNLMTLGWIHTHPSQECFLSSVDLHTQFSYQLMMPEAVAIVCAPTARPNLGNFSLTPLGMEVLSSCSLAGFHQHRENEGLYGHSAHIVLDPARAMPCNFVDLRAT